MGLSESFFVEKQAGSTDRIANDLLYAQNEQQTLENYDPFGAGVSADGDLNSLIDQLEGSVVDEMELYARDTVLGTLLPEQTDYEKMSMERSAMSSMDRGSALGNFTLGTAIGLVGDLPTEVALALTTSGVGNLASRAATAARASTN